MLAFADNDAKHLDVCLVELPNHLQISDNNTRDCVILPSYYSATWELATLLDRQGHGKACCFNSISSVGRIRKPRNITQLIRPNQKSGLSSLWPQKHILSCQAAGVDGPSTGSIMHSATVVHLTVAPPRAPTAIFRPDSCMQVESLLPKYFCFPTPGNHARRRCREHSSVHETSISRSNLLY